MRLLFGLVAAAVFAFAGYEMVNLHSTAGNTVAEAWDNYFGIFSFAMAFLSIAVALPTPSTPRVVAPEPTIVAPAPRID
jgi:hypothetical protein